MRGMLTQGGRHRVMLLLVGALVVLGFLFTQALVLKRDSISKLEHFIYYCLFVGLFRLSRLTIREE